MTCVACSKPLPEIAAFCPHCGKAAATTPTRPRWKGVALWLGALILALFSIAYFSEIGRTISLHRIPSSLGFETPVIQWVLKASNGRNLCVGLVLLGLTLLVLDSATRGRVGRFLATPFGTRGLPLIAILALGGSLLIAEERGRPAWLFAAFVAGCALMAAWKFKIRAHAVAPQVCAVLAFGGAAWIGFVETVRHPDPDEMARIVTELQLRWNVSNAGDLALVRENGRRTHVARITPDLVRAFRREGIPAGHSGTGAEFLFPGWLPLYVLAAALVLERLFSRGDVTFHMRLAAVFGAIGLFVVTWTAMAQEGMVKLGNFVHPDTIGHYFLLLALGATFLRRGYAKMSASTPRERSGWAFPYFFFMLAAPVGVYLVTPHVPGSPLLAGVLGFAGLGSLAWSRVGRPRPGEAS